MPTTACPKCGRDDTFQPPERRTRILVSAFAGVITLIAGLALTVIGIGLPLLLTAPVVALLLYTLPWKRCRNCGHIGIVGGGTK